jgi:anti-sigma B factor antagonist
METHPRQFRPRRDWDIEAWVSGGTMDQAMDIILLDRLRDQVAKARRLNEAVATAQAELRQSVHDTCAAGVEPHIVGQTADLTEAQVAEIAAAWPSPPRLVLDTASLVDRSPALSIHPAPAHQERAVRCVGRDGPASCLRSPVGMPSRRPLHRSSAVRTTRCVAGGAPPGTDGELPPVPAAAKFRLMAEDFSTEVNATDEATVIHVRGEIDITTAGRLRDAIEPHMGPKQTIILDFSEVEFMDSSALHVLVQARGQLTKNGGSLILRNPSKAAHRLLTVTGASDLLETDAQDHPSDSN